MNIGSLFLSLGIKSDTKSLEEAIKKVEELKKQTQELNKALKEAKSNTKLDVQTSTSKIKTPKESALLREQAASSAARLRIAKTELGFINLEEQAKNKQEREQKKREKAREKATKDFFNQVENGFSFLTKLFVGGAVAGGIGGYITAQSSKQASLSASLAQYGIDPEKSQRYANVFRRASGGLVGVPETNNFIANFADTIARGLRDKPELLQRFSFLGIDPSSITDFESAFKAIREYGKNPNYDQGTLTTLLSDLGVSKEFAPAFGKGFSDKEFEDAYNNAKILTNEQNESLKKLNVRISELTNAFDILKGTLLDKFAPTITKIIDNIEGKLTPEGIGKAADYAVLAGGGLLASKAIKFATKNPVFATTAATYAATEYLTEGRSGEGFKELVYNPLASFKEGFKVLSGKKKLGDISKGNPYKSYEDYKDQMYKDYGTPLKSGEELITRDQALRELTEAITSTSISPTNNININTNINADSVDKTTAPFIANEINGNVNKALYNSKYPTLSVPK